MADQNTDQSQKTEEPTQKKLEDARKKGDIARSQDMRHVAMFMGALFAVAVLTPVLFAGLAPIMTGFLAGAHGYSLADGGAESLAGEVFGALGRALAPVLALMVVAAAVGGVMQGRPTIAWERVKPKFSKISPVAGLKRLFSVSGLVEFLKTLAKFGVVAAAALLVVWPHARRLEQLLFGPPEDMVTMTVALVFRIFLVVSVIVAIIGLADYVYQRFAFLQKMRMSRQEVKDEHKQSEGDPQVKARVRQIRMERARRRMMAAVPTADVVITNPTHFAVALKYDHGKMVAPVVVAKGVDAVAFRIREVAGEHRVPIVENPPLARAIHATVEIDEPVKPEQYQAVAEVIGYVMRLKRGQRGRLPRSPS